MYMDINYTGLWLRHKAHKQSHSTQRVEFLINVMLCIDVAFVSTDVMNEANSWLLNKKI